VPPRLTFKGDKKDRPQYVSSHSEALEAGHLEKSVRCLVALMLELVVITGAVVQLRHTRLAAPVDAWIDL
jgi:hypothetical protein